MQKRTMQKRLCERLSGEVLMSVGKIDVKHDYETKKKLKMIIKEKPCKEMNKNNDTNFLLLMYSVKISIKQTINWNT